MESLAELLGVTVTNITSDTGNDGFQMQAQDTTLPPIVYSDADSDSDGDEKIKPRRGHSYRPLKSNEIRLLILNPGKREDPIECYLEHYGVSSAKSYHALSYVWGDTSNPAKIRLDGSEFPVTYNLGAFLRARRKEDECYVLWIDALCINQQDILERNSQIRLMKRVYEGADQITIWLGNPGKYTEAAANFLNEYYEADDADVSSS